MIHTIIATDMDGTFLRPDGTYDSKRLGQLIPRLHEAGYLFVVASGRSLLTLKGLFLEIEEPITFIAENGCIIEDDGHILFESQMSPTHYLDIIDILNQDPACRGYLLSGKEGAYVSTETSQDYIDVAKRYYDNVQRRDLRAVDDTILKVSAQFDHDKAHSFTASFNQSLTDFQAVVTGFDGMDIIPRSYNKSTALTILCQKYQLSMANVIAFGDNYNDLEMLSLAGKAIVPDNAIFQAKTLADKVIAANSQDSVLTYLEGLVHT